MKTHVPSKEHSVPRAGITHGTVLRKVEIQSLGIWSVAVRVLRTGSHFMDQFVCNPSHSAAIKKEMGLVLIFQFRYDKVQKLSNLSNAKLFQSLQSRSLAGFAEFFAKHHQELKSRCGQSSELLRK